MAIVHQQFDGAQGTIILAGMVEGGVPCGSAQSNAVGIFIGAVDNAVAGPALSPRVGDNPCAGLTFVLLAYHSVAVEGEMVTKLPVIIF